MRTVAVFGSNSFSGSDLCDLLLEDPDRRVIGISRQPEKTALFLPYLRWGRERFRFVQCDLNHDLAALESVLDEEQPEGIVNFAAQSEVGPSWATPWEWYETNVVSLSRLTHYLKDQPWLKRYVHISSPEVYGTCEGRVTEDAPMNPSTPYAASKAAADYHLSTLCRHCDFPLVSIRATNVYGAHQQLHKIIPRTAIYLKLGRRIPLHGGGVSVKSFIHIRDVSRGELLALEQGRAGEIYHLSPDDGGHAVRDVVARLCQRMGHDFDACTEVVGERLGQDAAYVIDSAKAREALGWRPTIGIDEGLGQVAAWVERCWAEIAASPLEYQHRP